MKKKVIAFIVIFAVALTCVAAFSGCAEDTGHAKHSGFDFVYDAALGGLVLDVSYSASIPSGSNLVLPSSSYFYKNDASADETDHDKAMAVVAIADGAFMGTSVVSVTLPTYLKKIGNEAFKSCTSLETITLPNAADSAVVEVGDSAFFSCSKLATINGDTSLSSIGDSAFYQCMILLNTQFSLATGATIGDRAFFYDISIPSIDLTNAAYVGSRAFAGWLERQVITLPSDTSAWAADWLS